jgi:hypothetical protein
VSFNVLDGGAEMQLFDGVMDFIKYIPVRSWRGGGWRDLLPGCDWERQMESILDGADRIVGMGLGNPEPF